MSIDDPLYYGTMPPEPKPKLKLVSPRFDKSPLTRADVERIVDERMAPLANTLNRLADVIEKQSRVLEKLVPGSKGE